MIEVEFRRYYKEVVLVNADIKLHSRYILGQKLCMTISFPLKSQIFLKEEKILVQVVEFVVNRIRVLLEIFTQAVVCHLLTEVYIL